MFLNRRTLPSGASTAAMGIAAAQAQPLPAKASYANDAAATTGGVPVGGVYRNGSVVQVRVI